MSCHETIALTDVCFVCSLSPLDRNQKVKQKDSLQGAEEQVQKHKKRKINLKGKKRFLTLVVVAHRQIDQLAEAEQAVDYL